MLQQVPELHKWLKKITEQRWPLAVITGGLFTLGLFYFMSTLVSNKKSYLKDKDEGQPIEFLRFKQDETLETRRRRPPKPPEPKAPPTPPKIKVSSSQPPAKPQMAMNMPQLSQSLKMNSGLFLSSGAQAAGSEEVLPLVRIEPLYPRQAQIKGLEGWVELQFDVDANGAVKNVRILKSKPRRVFDSSARRAVLKWKYRPKVVDGKAVVQKNLTTRFNFVLQGEE